jgi:hypothetical protein
MGNKSSSNNIVSEKEQTIFKPDLYEIHHEENFFDNCGQYNGLEIEYELLKVLSKTGNYETNNITNNTSKIDDHDQVNLADLTDKDKFILKLKFLLLCHYAESKPLKFNFGNITNEHVKFFVEKYNFNEHAEEIELLMPHKLIKNIKEPLIFPFKMDDQLKENKETQNQLNQLIVKYFKQIDPSKLNIGIIKNLFCYITKRYHKCLTTKQLVILCSKLKNIDLNSDLISDDNLTSFLKSISFNTLLGKKQMITFDKLSTQDKIKFIINSNDETFSEFSEIKYDVFLYSCDLEVSKEKLLNFSQTLMNFICEELNGEQLNGILKFVYELKEQFTKNESYKNEHNKIYYKFYQDYYFPTLSDEEQLKNMHFGLTFDDQYELYKLNEELYVKILCHNELILELTFKPYYLNEFRFLSNFSDNVQTYLKNKIGFDESAVTLEGMPEGPIKTLDDLIDVFVFTFDPPAFLYKKDLLNIHPFNIQLIRDGMEAIGYDMNKYSYKKFKLVMMLAETQEVEEIINYNKDDNENSDCEEDDEHCEEDDEHCEEDDEHCENQLEYEMDQTEQYLSSNA